MFKYIRGLFSTERKADISEKTIQAPKISSVQNNQVTASYPKITPPQIQFGCGQSVGMQRDHNEDTLFTLSTVLADGGGQIPAGIFIIADGMGGHLHGEVASGIAVREMAGHLMGKLVQGYLGVGSSDDVGDLMEIMSTGAVKAHKAVTQNAPGGGTTLTAALVIADRITVAHVGDSRLYFITPDGEGRVMTEDHSLVRRLQDMGEISEAEALVHPQRNVLYQALGQPEPLKPEIKSLTFPRPGWILLCSDGLWGVAPEREIIRIILENGDLPKACQLLVETANKYGGPDNISAILIQYLG
ncbi:MAG TPA: protein phosphatase 2C domain-containing protein [Anaerolineaceae bacterium]